MKRELESCIMISSSRVTELIKKLFEDGGELLDKANILNLSDYSTKFKDIR